MLIISIIDNYLSLAQEVFPDDYRHSTTQASGTEKNTRLSRHSIVDRDASFRIDSRNKCPPFAICHSESFRYLRLTTLAAWHHDKHILALIDIKELRAGTTDSDHHQCTGPVEPWVRHNVTMEVWGLVKGQ